MKPQIKPDTAKMTADDLRRHMANEDLKLDQYVKGWILWGLIVGLCLILDKQDAFLY